MFRDFSISSFPAILTTCLNEEIIVFLKLRNLKSKSSLQSQVETSK